jgi:hypothetical protein
MIETNPRGWHAISWRSVMACTTVRVSRLTRQKLSGYNKRSRLEAAIGRYKQVIGDGLRSRWNGRRTTEGALLSAF